MHMYRVIQISPLLSESIIALHGQYEEALDHARRCNASASGRESGFTYYADADPVMVTVTSID